MYKLFHIICAQQFHI